MNILRLIEEMKYATKEVKTEDVKQFFPSLLMRSLMIKSIDTSRLRPTVFIDLVGATNLEYLVTIFVILKNTVMRFKHWYVHLNID